VSNHGSTRHRSTARAVGALFIVASATAVAGGTLVEPITEDGADLAALHGQVSTGVLLEVVLALSVLAIAVLLVPVLRTVHEGGAIGYAALRTIEGGFVLLATSTAVVAVSLAESGSLDPAGGGTLDLLLTSREWAYFTGTMLVFSVSAVVLNALLLATRLVPRWLSGWGLVGGLLLLMRAVLELYGLEASLGLQFLWAAPIALQEMVFAVWLIVRGFDTGGARVAATTEGEPTPAARDAASRA
jgi:hypothetical protein